ncbi:MAG: hypothetical protein ACLTTU_07620 [Bilophila wadsworthia]
MKPKPTRSACTLTSAGYRPQGLQGAFEKIRRKQWPRHRHSRIPVHPDVGGRINEIHARIQGFRRRTQP